MYEVKYKRLLEDPTQLASIIDGEFHGNVDENTKDREIRELLRDGWYMQTEGVTPITKITLIKELPNLDARDIIKFMRSSEGDWFREENGARVRITRDRLTHEVMKYTSAGWYFQRSQGGIIMIGT